MSNFHADALMRSWALSDPTVERNTLRGISRLLKQAVDKPDGLSPEVGQRLGRAAADFLPQVEQAIQDALRLLGRLPEQSPMSGLYAESLDAFRQAHAAVSLLINWDLGCEASLERLSEALGRVEGAEAILAENLGNWDAWKNSSVLRCSRCGYGQETDDDEEICPHCEVDLLLADTRSTSSVLSEQAILGPEYVRAFRVYLLLQDGEATLRQFADSLAALQKLVAKWQKISNAGALRTLEHDLQDALTSAIADSQAGLAKIFEAHTTRDWADINDGWELLYRAGVSMQSRLPRLYRALGEPEAANDLESIFRTRDLSATYS